MASSSLTRLPVGRVEDFVSGRPIMVQHGRRAIGIYRVGEEFCAILDICPHQGIPICPGRVGGTYAPSAVGEFCPTMQGEVLACPWHGWQFHLLTGRSLHDPACRLKTFPTEVLDGTVYVVI